MNTFEKLLEPTQIGTVKLRNRMVKPGQGTGFATDDGYVSDRITAFYEAIARGGVGLIMVEICCVESPIGLSQPGHLIIDDDKFLPGLSTLVAAIHKHNCPVFSQLGHAGPKHPNKISGMQPIGPSALSPEQMPTAMDRHYVGPREMTLTEIHGLVEKFAKGALRAKRAGFDGVELHACHDYMLNAFFSRVWNKRQDDYGCRDIKSRARIHVEIIRAIKSLAGKDYPVAVRINGAEYGHKDATTLEESIEFARVLQEAGADAIHVSAWGYGPYPRLHLPEQIFFPEPPKPFLVNVDPRHGGAAAFAIMTGAIKKVTSIPIIAVGRYNPVLAEQVIREGKADLVSFGRRLFADPELPNKIAAGRLEDIAPCTACLECNRSIETGGGIHCRINAALGREREFEIKPAQKKKKVLVVGGGPSGMEAARVAALRGHNVTLYERAKLGGLLPLASLVKGPEIEDLPALINYFKAQITKLDVNINVGKEVSPALIESLKPDVVILATGGLPITPQIKGIENKKVLSTGYLHKTVKGYLRLLGPGLMGRLSHIWMPMGKRVVIIGGGIQGVQLAEFLVKRNRQVTIVETLPIMGTGMVERSRVKLVNWLKNKGVTMLNEVKYEEITDKGLIITTKDGKKQTIAADSIATAMGLARDAVLFESLKGKVPEIYSIGDCSEPGLIVDAIHAGSAIGRAI